MRIRKVELANSTFCVFYEIKDLENNEFAICYKDYEFAEKIKAGTLKHRIYLKGNFSVFGLPNATISVKVKIILVKNRKGEKIVKRNWKRILAAILASTMLLADSSVAFATESVEQMNGETQQEDVTTENSIDDIPIELTEQISASEESETTKLFNSLNTDEELTKASVNMIGVGDAFIANYDEDSSPFTADYYFMPEKTGYYGFEGISGRYAFKGHFENEEWIVENEIESYYKLAEDGSTIEKYYELDEGECYNIHVAAYLDEGESINYFLTEDEAGDTAQTISLDGGKVNLSQGEKKLYKLQTSNPTSIAVKVNGCATIDILDYD